MSATHLHHVPAPKPIHIVKPIPPHTPALVTAGDQNAIPGRSGSMGLPVKSPGGSQPKTAPVLRGGQSEAIPGRTGDAPGSIFTSNASRYFLSSAQRAGKGNAQVVALAQSAVPAVARAEADLPGIEFTVGPAHGSASPGLATLEKNCRLQPAPKRAAVLNDVAALRAVDQSLHSFGLQVDVVYVR
jgi:hypothetical protein